MDSPKRDADTTDGTMSIVELNNLVMSFRIAVRYARIVVVKKLAKQVNTYKTKKGTEEQVKTNLRKAERLQEQIAVLKKCKDDKITKFCLASKFNLEEVAQKGTTEEKALTRVACQKLIRTKVCDWRKARPDWQLLCEKLNTWVSKRVRNKDTAILKTEILFKKKEQGKLEESANEKPEGSLENESEADSPDETEDSYKEEKNGRRKTKERVKAAKSHVKKRQEEASGSGDDDDDDVSGQKVRKLNSSASDSPLNKKKQKSESSIQTISDKYRDSNKSEKCKAEKPSHNKDSAPEKLRNASVHPSWEAKKKEKERNFITFQHKSVIFSD